MQKTFAALLAILAGLAALAIGLVAARASHVTVARAASTARAAAASNASLSAATAGADSGRVIRFVKNGQPAPPFLIQDIDGRVISTAAWQGKVVLLNFWATWCPPCREEIPILIELTKKYPDRLLIIGISMDDGPVEDVKSFTTSVGVNYPIVMWSRELVFAYGGVPALPTSFLVNDQGRVVQKHVGLFPGGLYEIEVRALLGLPVDATVETFEDTGQIFLKNAERATELPGVDLSGLTPEQRKAALKRFNSEGCDCGCTLTIAQCRINDTACPISKTLGAKIVKEILAASPAPAAASALSPQASN